MIENFNNPHFCQKEEEEEKNNNIKKLDSSLKSDLNIIEENEENIKFKEEEHLSEEESLGYNSNYKLNNAMNKNNQNSINNTNKRKASTLSTTMSQTDTFSDSYSFLPPNNIKSQNSQNYERKASFTQSEHVFFGRDRLNSNPITTYFEGMDFYLRSLHPEKIDYQKTNNYIEKDYFFNKDFKYKSFDLSEKKLFNSTQKLENLNLEEKFKNTSSLQLENNTQNQKNINNYQNAFIPIIPKSNNCMYGKFDMPMYYVRYYNVDCKYIYNLIF